MQKLLNCDRFRMNEIINSINKSSVVYTDGDYYTIEQQMIEYFEAEIVKRNYRIFYLIKIDELFDSFLVCRIMK